jgi:hypothetical protein
MDQLTVKGTIHKVYPIGIYPAFVLKFTDGSYERYLHITLSKKLAERINEFEPGGEAEVLIAPGSGPSKNDPERWNNTNWCNKINYVRI